MVDLPDLISYIIIIFILWKAYKAEWIDLHCDHVNQSKCKDFGGGMAYKNSKPDLDDEPSELLDKIERASYTEELTVKWRRCYILAFFIMTLSWAFVMFPIIGRFPRFYEAGMLIFIAMMIIYYSFNYYAFHHYEAPTQYIRASTELLRDKLNLRKSTLILLG
jgi:hypothetical protein